MSTMVKNVLYENTLCNNSKLSQESDSSFMSVVKRFDQILSINSQIKLNLKKPNQTIVLSCMLRLFPALLTFTVLVPHTFSLFCR